MSGVVLTRNTGINTSGKTFNIGNGYRGIMVILDSATARSGMYFLSTTSSGVVNLGAIAAADQTTINTSVAGEITLTPDSGTRNVLFLTTGGAIS